MTYLSLQTPDGLKRVQASPGPGGVDTPVHHSQSHRLFVVKTCPNSVANYAQGDAIGAADDVVFEFNIGALGYKSATIIAARLARKATAVVAPRFRVWLHDAPLATLTNADDAPKPLLWANVASRAGHIDFVSPIASDAPGGDMLEYIGQLSDQQGLIMRPADGIIRALVTTRDAFARVALEAYGLQLSVVC